MPYIYNTYKDDIFYYRNPMAGLSMSYQVTDRLYHVMISNIIFPGWICQSSILSIGEMMCHNYPGMSL